MTPTGIGPFDSITIGCASFLLGGRASSQTWGHVAWSATWPPLFYRDRVVLDVRATMEGLVQYSQMAGTTDQGLPT